jgi:hypothetical protein
MSHRFINSGLYLGLMAKGTIVKSVKDALAVGASIIESAQNETAWLLPPTMLVFAAQYGLQDKSKMLIQNGGRVRGVFSISSLYVELARSLLDIGENLRHVGQYEGVFFLVGDKKQSISSIHINVEELSIDDQIVAFWSEAPTYAEYLLSNFEQAWAQGVDAQERMHELLERGPLEA